MSSSGGGELPGTAPLLHQGISPQQGLLRVREFTLAEIEHFVDPQDKSHPNYLQVADLEFMIFPKVEQMSGQSAKRIPLRDAVSKTCWDVEIECSFGWIECVGIADRSAYDLRAHSDKSDVLLVACEKFSEPKEVEKLVITPVKTELGLAFKPNQRMVVEALEAIPEK